jgi:acyl-CoA synthetase (AMP-forming)/AMP-acid ligase II
LVAALLDYSVRHGDWVVVMMPNRRDLTAAFHALWRIDAAMVSVPPEVRPASD